MVDPAKEYSTHSNGLEVYMECVVLPCSMVIKESLKISKSSMFHSSFRCLFFAEDSYFIYVICIYFQQHDVRGVKQ
jgi:hypothetical protein